MHCPSASSFFSCFWFRELFISLSAHVKYFLLYRIVKLSLKVTPTSLTTFPRDLELWPMMLTLEYYVDSVKLNQQAKYPSQRLHSSKVIISTHTHTHTHTHPTDCSTGPLKCVVMTSKHCIYKRHSSQDYFQYLYLLTTTTTTPQPFYGHFSGTTRVSRCQKRTSRLYGARED